MLRLLLLKVNYTEHVFQVPHVRLPLQNIDATHVISASQ